MTTTTNHNIQRLLSFLLPQRLQIITVVILAFISFLDVSVYAASSSSSTATSWNGHKQNDNNGKRQLQSERGLQLPRSTSAPASSSTSSSASTSTAPMLMLDAATSYEISNDYNFHYMVTLSQPSLAAADTAANAENEPTVRFYWKVPSDLDSQNDNKGHGIGHGYRHSRPGLYTKRKKIQCRLVHESTPLLTSRTSWLGFGVQGSSSSSGSSSNVGDDNDNDVTLTGSDTLFGFINNDNNNENEGETLFEQYVLKSNFQVEGGVEQRTTSATTAASNKPLFLESESYITRKTHTDNRVTTTFDFAMIIYDDNDDNDTNGVQESSSSSNSIHEHGENVFVFAIGPATTSSEHNSNSNNYNIGAPVKTGSLKIDFHQVGTTVERSYFLTAEQQTNCTSDDARYDYMLALKGNIKLYWKLVLDPFNNNNNNNNNNADWIDVQLSHLGKAWVAFGVAEDENGMMVGSDAIICRPALSAAIGEQPLKYHMSSVDQSGVYPMASFRQTLADTSCTQNGDGDDNDDDETILRFTKKLVEDGENPISKTNATTFLYAIGGGNILTKHVFANSFNLDVNKCPLDTDSGNITTGGNHKARWVAHGIFGTLAFAVAVPSSLASAFLRQLMPTTWIFFHVYGNIVALTLTLITFLIAVLATSKSGEEHFNDPHGKIGLSLLVLSLFQILGGVLRPDKVTRQNPVRITKRNIWKWLHHVLGSTILSLGLYQVGDGLSMFAEDYGTYNLAPVYFVMLAICLSIVGGAKLWVSLFVEERTFRGSGVDTEVENLQQGSRYPETEMI